MTLDMAKSIISEALLADDDCDFIEFDFHGGELALAFGRLKEICDWLWAQDWPKEYACYGTTNGTLIHNEIQDWFAANSNRFRLGLSLDGTREMHNLNRSNSYDNIDLDFFKATWPDQSCKMTVSKLSLPYLCECIKHVHSLGFSFSANLAYGLDWDDSLLSVYRDQLAAVCKFYLDNPDLKVVNLLNLPIFMVGLADISDTVPRKKWCGTGSSMVCFAPDGKKYPCQAFMPSSEVVDGEQLLSKFKFDDIDNFLDDKCKNCIFERACPTCYAHNFMESGNLRSRVQGLCKYRKVEAVAASYLQGMMIREGNKYRFVRETPTRNIPLIAKGALLIQNAFADEVESF